MGGHFGTAGGGMGPGMMLSRPVTKAAWGAKRVMSAGAVHCILDSHP